MPPTRTVRPLHELALAHGLQTAYYGVDQRRRVAGSEALLHVLRLLDVPVAGLSDVQAALRERRLEQARTAVQPVAVAWKDAAASVEVRRPVRGDGVLRCRLDLESGETKRWQHEMSRSAGLARMEVEGAQFVSGRLPLPDGLPTGYHRLSVAAGDETFSCLIVCAPQRAYGAEQRNARRRRAAGWGVFLPLWALRSRRSGAVGDLTDLAALMEWTAGLGGSAVGTLPLLAGFLEQQPNEPSPYAPVSRLFWNEIYLDPALAPELDSCVAVRQRLESREFAAALRELRREPLVDYHRQMELKRPLFQQLADRFFSGPGHRDAGFRRFMEDRPELEEYARFRAVTQRCGTGWRNWSAGLRDGPPRSADFDDAERRYHVYVQWLAHRQLMALDRGGAGPELYLDLPLGVHPDGFDCWRYRHLFADGASGGAPPDTFFTGGQDWGFPPLRPDRIREEGYAYFRACLRNHMRYAGMLRIDHVMSLHRLFWVPHGSDAKEGVYVRYPAEELYALLSVESHRHETVVVGEDLGTVPRYIRRAMGRHGLRRIFVVQYEAQPDAGKPLPVPPGGAVAGLNTHDTPTFAGFCRGLDLRDWRELGLLDEAGARHERHERQRVLAALAEFLEGRGLLRRPVSDAALMRAALEFLAELPAGLLLVNLEDLWLETRPQNVPGTVAERPNWRRPARYLLEEFRELPSVLGPLHEINNRINAYSRG